MPDDTGTGGRISRLEEIVDRRLALVQPGQWTGEQVKAHLEAEVLSLGEQLDRRIGTLKELMLVTFAEKDRALKMADDEREKAAAALRREQNRALDQANQEREKAAQILRESLIHQIESGDLALRQHMSDQVAQVRILIDSYTMLASTQHEASEKAILKAENAAEKRFESVNEFRAQLAAQTQSFMPREVAEAKFAEIATKVDDLTARVNTTQGKSAGITASIGLMIAVCGVALAIIVVVVNVLLAS